MITLNRIEQVDYLAALDTGNASIRWPQKDPRNAGILQNQYSQQIERILKLNLMWRPSIAVRHFDLFDNLALAKFVVHNESICQELSMAGLLRVCSPRAATFEEILEHWALAGGPDDPMHWHHLSPRQQEGYDRASRGRKLKSAAEMEQHLHLADHGLSLQMLFRAYDALCPISQIMVVQPLDKHQPDSYADRVEKKWQNYMDVRNGYGFAATRVTRDIERVVEGCCRAKGRRRAFYSQLERSITATRYAGLAETIEAEVLETKCLVLNDAFYDEFEQFQSLRIGATESPVRITASRDIRKEWFPLELSGRPVQTPSDALLSVSFSPLDEIRLSDILRLHTAEDPEANAFQASIRNLRLLHIRSRSAIIPGAELGEAIKNHVTILRDCVLRQLMARSKADLINDARAKVYLGYPATAIAIAGGLASLAESGLSSLAFGMVSGLTTGVLGLVFTGLFTFWLEKNVSTNEWLQVEAAVQESIETETTPAGAGN